MKTFKQKNFKRDYEVTNVKFIQCKVNPDKAFGSDLWVECEASEIDCQQLWREYDLNGEVIKYGHL
jgi:hypothetical protein